jgi:DNA-binding XRE family transcriptional regulator
VSPRDYPATVDVAGRTLSPAVLKALTYWPEIVDAEEPVPVDLAVLSPFFNDLLDELPWWTSIWRVTQVEPACPHEFASDHDRQKNRFVEVSVPGTLGGGAGQALPFVARVRFEGDRLLRFQAKMADMVVGPALAEAGAWEPHPFGAVLRKLMDNRGVSVKELAMQTGRAMSTIKAVRTGRYNPHPVLAREIARALGMPEADLAAVAGVDDATVGVPKSTST